MSLDLELMPEGMRVVLKKLSREMNGY